MEELNKVWSNNVIKAADLPFENWRKKLDLSILGMVNWYHEMPRGEVIRVPTNRARMKRE